MKILGIETSCDETSCAVVEDGRRVLSNIIASQIDLHAKTGGVVPEVAAREHVLKMIPVLEDALSEAKLKDPRLRGDYNLWDDIDAIAITQGPGLISSLIVGTETANVISFVKNKPLIPVMHIVGHIYSNWLDAPTIVDSGSGAGMTQNGAGMTEDTPQFPIIILTVSGGHNELVLMPAHNEFHVLGESLDDAAGEAFDKVARILGLGYPGGPVIAKAAIEGDPHAFKLPISKLGKDSLNFSFSGLKTAVLNEVKDYISKNNTKSEKDFDQKFVKDLAASFQETTCQTLAANLIKAYKKYPEVKELHLSGGVSANLRLREIIQEKLPTGIKFRHPKSIKFCTDNAAMIACAGHYLYQLAPSKYKVKTNITPTTSFEIQDF